MSFPFVLSIISVALSSIISLIGLLTFPFDQKKVQSITLLFVAFAVGALLGDTFLHLLPSVGISLTTSLVLLSGIIVSFVIDSFLNWNHFINHKPHDKKYKIQTFAIMNLFGDGVHNFIDGLIIGTAYALSIPVGIATTIAVIFHEIPQEISDFTILLHGGFSKRRALLFNFLIALISFLGLGLSFVISKSAETLFTFLVPFAAGCFLYIACSTLIPLLQKEKPHNIQDIVRKAFSFVLGVLFMLLLLLIG